MKHGQALKKQVEKGSFQKFSKSKEVAVTKLTVL